MSAESIRFQALDAPDFQSAVSSRLSAVSSQLASVAVATSDVTPRAEVGIKARMKNLPWQEIVGFALAAIAVLAVKGELLGSIPW